MKNIFLIFLSLTVIFSAGLSCKTRHNNEKDSSAKGLFGLGGFAKDVTGKRSCPTKPGFLDSGEKPTWVFHWTNSEEAVQNPKRYLEEVVRSGNIANADPEKLKNGMAGNGLYAALDPFQSITYGKILIAFPVLPHSIFPSLKGIMGGNPFAALCSGAVYTFESGIKNRFKPDSNLLSDQASLRALVLWDLASISPAEIVSWQTDSGPAPKILDSATASEIKHLKNYSDSEQTTVVRKFIPFLNNTIGSEESKVQEILMAQLFDQTLDCIHKKGIKPYNASLGIFHLPFILKQILDIKSENRGEIFKMWQLCGKELGIGNGNETNFEDIANAIDLYVNKDIAARTRDFKDKNGPELERLKQVVEFWTSAYTIENWKPVKE